MLLRRYKDTLVGHGSALEFHLEAWDKVKNGKNEELKSAAKKLVDSTYETTTEAYKRLYPDPEHRAWFQMKSFPPKLPPPPGDDHGTIRSSTAPINADSNASRDAGASHGQV